MALMARAGPLPPQKLELFVFGCVRGLEKLLELIVRARRKAADISQIGFERRSVRHCKYAVFPSVLPFFFCKARHQGLGEREGPKVCVEVQFAGAAARRLNDREDMLVVSPRRQFQKIGHLFLKRSVVVLDDSPLLRRRATRLPE
jgi:hypothetical protein